MHQNFNQTRPHPARALGNLLVRIFTSLQLTVILLAFAIVLVFVGTLAQVDEGLYNAQERYFRQWLIFGLDLFGHRIPVLLPGGYLIGTMLLLNLISAHIYRFRLTTKKIGIQLAHGGVILLIVGQLATDMLAHESQMRFGEGETKSYSESAFNYELVFKTDPDGAQIASIPDRLLAQGGEIHDPTLPFTIRVKSYWKNSDPSFRAKMMQNGPPLTPNGIANNFDFRPMDETKTQDEKNVPTALVEIIDAKGSLGDWVVSGWTGDDTMIDAIRQNYGAMLGPKVADSVAKQLAEPQTIESGGKKFAFGMRPARVNLPFSLELLKATHTVYEGTDIPKDFRSRVVLRNPQTGENREVEISMNHPLRYAGLTFYQYQMDAGQAAQQAGRPPTSVLQVVRNPGWLTPYIGCGMVAFGLMIQFLSHLIGFLSKRRTSS
jgi:ResB-like family